MVELRQKAMRGKPQAQPDFLTVINLNQCVPADHPLRAIKRRVDVVLKQLSPLFDELYEELGRPAFFANPSRPAAAIRALICCSSSSSSTRLTLVLFEFEDKSSWRPLASSAFPSRRWSRVCSAPGSNYGPD